MNILINTNYTKFFIANASAELIDILQNAVSVDDNYWGKELRHTTEERHIDISVVRDGPETREEYEARIAKAEAVCAAANEIAELKKKLSVYEAEHPVE